MDIEKIKEKVLNKVREQYPLPLILHSHQILTAIDFTIEECKKEFEKQLPMRVIPSEEVTKMLEEKEWEIGLIIADWGLKNNIKFDAPTIEEIRKNPNPSFEQQLIVTLDEVLDKERDKILDTVEDYLFTRDNENIPITFREWENIKKEVKGIS